MAITAVVLGGASIFGGRGTVLGTVLGLFSIVLLQNGLRLSGQPAELSGILTGVLLVGDDHGGPAVAAGEGATDSFHNHRNGAGRRAQLPGGHPERGDPRRRADRGGEQLDAGELAAPGAARRRTGRRRLDDRRGRDCRTRRREAGRRAHAEGEGRPVLHQCAQGRRLRRVGARRRAAVGRSHRPRSREAERGGGSVDHARRERDRRERREQGGDLHRAAEGAAAGDQGRDVGRRRGEGRARLLRQPGHAAGDRLHAHGRGGAHHGRAGRVRDHHGEPERRESERVDQVHSRAAARSIPG